MSIETVYNEIKDITKNGEINYIKFTNLMNKLEEEIRKESCYKTTSKTRVNAIKRVASKWEDRPALTGYGIFGEYKGVTDSYHVILIKQDEMPLPLVATSDELKKLGINKEEYQNKYGMTSIINATYPNLMNCITFDYDKNNEVKLDINDLMAFIKTNKKDKNAIYKLGDSFYNPKYIKNVIDVLGENCKIYFQGEYKPLYFVNDNEELGVVLPIRSC
jgi:hypothetical protein